MARAVHARRVLTRNDPDVSVAKVHYPQEGAIEVHQERVCFCPPAGYFWYGKCRHSVGKPPKWVQSLLEKSTDEIQTLLVMAAESATEPVIQADESTCKPPSIPTTSLPTCQRQLL